MFNRLILFSVHQYGVVLLAVLALVLLGSYHFRHLPIDAVPDITNVQVQINTEAPGYSPLETEQQITFPIEFSLSGLPRLSYTRSLSAYGLSQITVVFEEGTDIYFARQLLSQKLQEIRGSLPAGLSPQLGPIASGLGEIYTWILSADPEARKADGNPYDAMDLRTLQDWVIRPQLKTVPGVTEVNTIGGYSKQYQISPYPEKLQAYGLSFRDVVQALTANNINVGAGYIEREGAQNLLRMPGRVSDLAGIRQIVLRSPEGVPVSIGDVAEVSLGQALRTGAATHNGSETVLGTAMMLMGANSREVSEAVDQRLAAINRSLPEGVQALAVYSRATLVEKTIATVEENLGLGALLVIVVLFLFLGNLRAALITALVIPLAMCFTITGMALNDISANLMSLGALDFGIIVDGSVVMTENCLRHLARRQSELQRPLNLKERMQTVFEASREARQALLFGELIIMVVYLPILALEGVEGKMFHPMALTVILALSGAMLLSMTFIPAALALLMRGKIQEKENRLMQLARAIYQPALNWSLQHSPIVLSLALSLLMICGVLSTKMGREFVPSLDEGDLAVHALRIPGTGLQQAIQMQTRVEQALLQVPEVQQVFSRMGTAEVATDPMPPNVADTFVIMKPRHKWAEPRLAQSQIIERIQSVLNTLPGNQYEFTQPIQMRFNELLSGTRSDVALKIYGDDLDTLLSQAQAAQAVIEDIPGASDVRTEQVSGLPVLTLQPRRQEMARYGLSMQDLQSVLEAAGAGSPAGEVFEGDRRFEMVVRLSESLRQDPARLQQIPVPLSTGERAFVPLSQVVDFQLSEGPNQISRENGKRRIVVSANVRGRDLGSFVSEARQAIDTRLTLPAGYWLSWGGEFEKLASASQRLALVIPVALVLILSLLYATLRQFSDTLLVFSGVPLALTGGVLALLISGLPLSISAGVGFIALSGVAVLNGLVMLTFMNQLCQQGLPLLAAVQQGALTRLRPVLMTALVASLGFVPMALATGTGAEVQRPLATVVIGGILSSTLLTLLVLPVLYYLVHRGRAARTLHIIKTEGPQS